MIELLYRLWVTWNETVKSVSVFIVFEDMGVNEFRVMDPFERAGMFKFRPELVRVVAIKLVELILGSE